MFALYVLLCCYLETEIRKECLSPLLFFPTSDVSALRLCAEAQDDEGMTALIQMTQWLQQFLVILGADAYPAQESQLGSSYEALQVAKLVKWCARGRIDSTAAKRQFEEVEKLKEAEKL